MPSIYFYNRTHVKPKNVRINLKYSIMINKIHLVLHSYKFFIFIGHVRFWERWDMNVRTVFVQVFTRSGCFPRLSWGSSCSSTEFSQSSTTLTWTMSVKDLESTKCVRNTSWAATGTCMTFARIWGFPISLIILAVFFTPFLLVFGVSNNRSMLINN